MGELEYLSTTFVNLKDSKNLVEGSKPIPVRQIRSGEFISSLRHCGRLTRDEIRGGLQRVF
jgi:hypothetical protein